ncbi:MAG: hypothetical protein M3081_03865 [Gemmatimonadota bacterium]|nr:hypothetical protein [Gemmatimonadota bacterium]
MPRFKAGKELQARRRSAKKGGRKGPTARSASKKSAKKSARKSSGRSNALKRASRTVAANSSPSPIERVKRVVSSVGNQGMDAARHFGENVMHAGEVVVDRMKPLIPGTS